MSDEPQLDPKRRCPEMILAGISDPDSQAGIDFCVGSCPYEYCVMMETNRKRLRSSERVRIAKGLRAQGVGLDDIALILGKDVNTVRRYLKKST